VNKITGRLQSDAALEEIGIAIPDWLLMRAVKDAGALSMSAAARKIGVSRQRIHQQATALQSAGFLTVSKGEDQKSRQLTFSSSGEALIADVEKRLLAALAREGKMPMTEIQAARRTAGKVNKILAPKESDENDPE
jgi:DNA-binding MarR family transcriptional regulator